MKAQVYNPYLPAWEYVPDGEPHVFGDRVYVYGSHDRFNAPMFCVKDYVCWSAPVSDLSDWRCEGVIYRKKQDPKNRLGLRLLFAPDVCRGNDGRYYMYYAFDFMGIMGVAVSDRPEGPFAFYGHVHYPDGTLWGRRAKDQFPFDPAVLVDDDKRVWLYSGFGISVPAIVTGGKKLAVDGGTVVELESDMLTIRTEPKVIFPRQGPGSFEGHAFFEASSIRKVDGRYIFVYSSEHNHELCYAQSQRPDGGFVFGGTLVDLGDLFHPENPAQVPKNYLGNTHGGLLYLSGRWYIFYHRQTNRHSYSRQACAEEIRLDKEGRFLQAEVTSCGLNGGPLLGEGRYEARIACLLYAKEGAGRYDVPHAKRLFNNHPYFTQKGREKDGSAVQYIANMKDGAVCGFRYFSFDGEKRISLKVGGRAKGFMEIAFDEGFLHPAARVPVRTQGIEQETERVPLPAPKGKAALFMRFVGEGSLDFYAFEIRK